VPAYAKFLKDLVTIKRKTNVPKKAYLTEHVSSILQCKLPIKYKDPECPTIPCMIGESQINRALLDLGATVNLLPDVNPVKNNETQQRKGTQDHSMDRFEGKTSTRCL
jgi:hypothetical protein